MAARQLGHTGSREIFNKGSPQMRQSEGKKTEKRLSATRVAQTRPRVGQASCGTIERPTTAILAWVARIRSSLLLKTASSSSRAEIRRGRSLLHLLQYSGDPCR